MRSVGLVATHMLTFLCADVEGSAAIAHRLGDTHGVVLPSYRRLILTPLTAHGGEEVAAEDDGLSAGFTCSRACVDAAIQLQRVLVLHRWSAGERVRVRMGIDSEEAAQTAAGLAGLAARSASRISAVAQGGQVVVSLAAAGLLAGRPSAAGVKLTDPGHHRRKDMGQNRVRR